MVERRRVGLFFSYNENWIGGTYYRLNLIHALNSLEDSKKPVIVLMTYDTENVERVRSETEYPYLDHIDLSKSMGKSKRAVNKFCSYLGFTPFLRKIKNPDVDMVYPNYDEKIESDRLKRTYWIADFQEAFFPELFTPAQLEKRKTIQKRIATTGDLLVFSSMDAQHHYNCLYPDSQPEQFVLNFAVTHPDLSRIDHDETLAKYGLKGIEYFFISNQFWVHKNHITALKALKILRENQNDILFVFSGKEHDNRVEEYVEELKLFVKENDLERNVRFLGFIPRIEQLIILKQSVAIIQPSLFEGWSTVVEDAKAQNKFIFLSDLSVHYEQAKENCTFFERSNPHDLASKIMETEIQVKNIDYSKNIEKFGLDFLKVIEKACSTDTTL